MFRGVMSVFFFSWSFSHRGDVTVWRNSCLESSSLESEGDTEEGEDTDSRETDTHSHTHKVTSDGPDERRAEQQSPPSS